METLEILEKLYKLKDELTDDEIKGLNEIIENKNKIVAEKEIEKKIKKINEEYKTEMDKLELELDNIIKRIHETEMNYIKEMEKINIKPKKEHQDLYEFFDFLKGSLKL